MLEEVDIDHPSRLPTLHHARVEGAPESGAPRRQPLTQRAISGRCTFHVMASRARKPAVQRAACFRRQDEFTRRLRRGGGRECRILSLIGVQLV